MMKTSTRTVVLLMGALLPLSAMANLPEQWICVNDRAVPGYTAVEVIAKTSIGGSPWRSIDVYLATHNSQRFNELESYSYPPAQTGVKIFDGFVGITGKNRRVFHTNSAGIRIDLTRAKRGVINSHLLSLLDANRRSPTKVYEAVLRLRTNSRADGETAMSCAELPSER